METIVQFLKQIRENYSNRLIKFKDFENVESTSQNDKINFMNQ